MTETSKTKGYPISYQQSRAWTVRPQQGPPLAWAVVRLTGTLEKDRLRRALDALITRNEILRTTFTIPTGMTLPFQVIGEPTPAVVSEADLRAGGENALFELIERTNAREVDYENGPLVSFTCATLGEREHALLISLPTVCADEGTFRCLVAELAALYDGGDTDNPLQYADIAKWMEGLMEDEDAEDAVAHWSDEAHGALQGLDLPSKLRGGGALQTNRIQLSLTARERDTLEILCERHDNELSGGLLIIWQALFRRLTGLDDLVVGMRFTGRNSEELENLLGPLARNLPMAAHFSKHTSFEDLAARLEDVLETASDCEEYFRFQQLGRGQDEAAYFPVVFSFDEKEDPIQGVNLEWQVDNRETLMEGFEIALRCREVATGVQLALEYDQTVYTRATATILGEQFLTLLRQVSTHPETPFDQLALIGEVEKTHLLHHYGPPEAKNVPDTTVHQAVAAQKDDAVAVVYRQSGEYQRMTYNQLNAGADKLAAVLTNAGVTVEDRVGLYCDRNPQCVVAMLAILKVGAVYVPMDPKFPNDRIIHIHQDAGLKMVLAANEHLDFLSGLDIPTLDMHTATADGASFTPPMVHPQQLAYVIYTSGSTGKPKGVGISHRNLLGYVAGLHARLNLSATAQMASPATMAADLGNTSLFGALCTGRTYRVFGEAEILDAELLAQDMVAEPVDCLKIVPNHFNALLSVSNPARLVPRECLICGGDVLDRNLVARVRELAPNCRIVNHYGPTEATIGVLAFEAKDGCEAQLASIPVGRPFANALVRVLDDNNGLCATGFAGELAIGGETLARGYWNAPGMTAARFVPDPFAQKPGARLYRTGDLARYGSGGELDFLGRNDFQVKIMGYRVELGEIESALRELDDVRENVVLLRVVNGKKTLTAYIIPAEGAKPGAANLREELVGRLADYMIPAAFVIQDKFPLTANGKIDRNALPDPEESLARKAYVAPRNEIEETLANIWSQVLGIDQIGIDDNFFELGGDSIMTIQVVARARGANIHFQPKMIFVHQTIGELSHYTTATAEIKAEQGLVSGEAPLVPIQARFFDIIQEDQNHYNLSIMVQLKGEVASDVLEAAFNALIRHHDALRSRFTIEDGAPVQRMLEEIDFTLETHDMSSESRSIAELADQAQAGLDLAEGPIMRVVRFVDAEAGDHLLIALHHLVVDGVSWRILLDDLETAVARLSVGEAVNLPPKTTAFKTWAQRLHDLAGSDDLAEDRAYWSARAEAAPQPLPRDLKVDAPALVADADNVTIELSEAETQALMRKVPEVFNNEINDVLMYAIAHGVKHWTGNAGVVLELEGHGREDLFDDVDTSRTVGWFTSRYPLLLTLPDGGDPVTGLKSVKEQMRDLPKHGIGYGILRYLGRDASLTDLLARLKPEINFNYLGNLDRVLSDDGRFSPSDIPAGNMLSPRQTRPHLINIQALVRGGCLQMGFNYSKIDLQEETVKQLADKTADGLRDVIAVSQDASNKQYTPSDFPQAKLNQEELDSIVDEISKDEPRDNISDIIPVVPLQHGMLYHSIADPGSGIYVVQLACDLEGGIDLPAFRKAWDKVLDRFGIFRALYLRVYEEKPIQVIRKKVELPWHIEDLNHLSEEEREARFTQYQEADRLAPFNFDQAPLMRMAMFHIADGHDRFLWCYHHVYSDGWSTPVVVQALLAYYQELRGGNPIQLPLSRPFSDYTRWLDAQDRNVAANYWRQYLEHIKEPTRISQDSGPTDVKTKISGNHVIRLPESFVTNLTEFTKRERLTANIFAQAAWSLLLAYHGKTNDVLFGCVTSGRPSDLANVEQMVGPFLNSVPVRNRINPETSVVEWMGRLLTDQVERDQYNHTPLVDIKKSTNMHGRPLFEYLFQFQNYPAGKELARDSEETGSSFAITSVRHFDYNNYPLTLVINMRDDFGILFMYNDNRIKRETVEQLTTQYKALLNTILEHPNSKLADLTAILEKADQENREKAKQEIAARSIGRLKRGRRRPGAIPHTESAPVAEKPEPAKAAEEAKPTGGPPRRRPSPRSRRSGQGMVTISTASLVELKNLHDDNTLPLEIRPTQENVDLISWAKANRETIEEKLLKHGGIAFRGFKASTLSKFGALADILIDEIINSTEHTRIHESKPIVRPGFYPQNDRLTWHNEKVYGEVWPTRIMFGSELPAENGGGASIIFDGRQMAREMEPKIKELFLNKKIMYIRNYSEEIGRPWQQIHQTNSKAEVEAFCRENGMTFEWRSEDRLRTRKVLPAFSLHFKTGEEVWFNQVQHWHSTSLDPSTRESLLALVGEEGMPRNCFFGDGTPIDDEVIYSLNALSERIDGGFYMEAGDVLLMDNMLVSHGREPYTGERKLLVAMGNPRSYSSLPKKPEQNS